MNAGDLVCFADGSITSRIIRWATGGPVSHVAAVYDHHWLVEPTPRTLGFLAKTSATLRMNEYADRGGRVWLLTLAQEYRERLDVEAYRRWLDDAIREREPYGFLRAVWSALPIIRNRRNGRPFCSYAYSAAMEYGGAFPEHNAAEVTPNDLPRLRAWSDCCQWTGKPVAICHYNAIPFDAWRGKIQRD